MRTFDVMATAKSKTEKSRSAIPSHQQDSKSPFFNYNTAHENAFFGLNTVQQKLEIGQSNDKYEKEADAVADNVMMQPDLEESVNTLPAELTLRRQTLDEEEEMLHMKPHAPLSAGEFQATPADLARRINSAKGGGQPLEPGVKVEMGNRFGVNFSNVRIHTGSTSVQMSRELGAKAFTVSNDIHFNRGQYAPYTAEGRHLLAHELAHVVQQVSTGNQKIDRQQVSTRPPADWQDRLPNVLRDASSYAHNAAERYATQVWRAAEAFESYAKSEVARFNRQVTGADLLRTLFAVFPSRLPHFIAGRVSSGFFRELAAKTAGHAYNTLTSATVEAARLGTAKKDLKRAISFLPERTKDLASTLPVFVSKEIDDKIDDIIKKPSSRWGTEDALFIRPFIEAMIESPAGVTSNQLHAIIESQIGLPAPSNAISFQVFLYRTWVEAFAKKRIIAESSTYWRVRDFVGNERIFDRMARAEGRARAEERRRHLERLTPG